MESSSSDDTTVATVVKLSSERSLPYISHSIETTDIPLKFRGTAIDQRDMVTMGRKQVLKRNFSFITMLAFTSTVICSWEVLLPFFIFVLTDGGTALLFWGMIACAIGQTLVYASIAEAASMSPTAGGQYHWVSEFSPRRWQKLLSYTTGWLTAIAWQVYLASVCFMVGTIIQGLIVLNNPTYKWEYWHGTLLTIAISAFSIIFNTVLAARLPLLQAFALVLHIAGLFAIILPLWIMAPRTPAKVAFFEFSNHGGWPTTGLSAMIGLVAPMSSLSGYDCAVHMAEEIQDASIVLPRAIMWSTVVNASMALVMSVTLIFTLGDIDNLLASPTRQPFIQLFYNATQSYPGTNVMVALVVILIGFCCIDETATASRQAWAFARDGGFPFSKWLSEVTPGWDVPLRAVCLSFVITSLLACINLGSTTALNAINSLGVTAILGSYFLTISCIVYRRIRGPALPARRWSLGRFGLPINIAALAFLLPIWFFLVWPLATPVTPTTMNWAPVMFVGVLAIALIYYVVRGRHVYLGPVVLVKRDE